MLREIERLRRERLDEIALRRAKSYLLGQFALDRRTNVRLAWYEAFFEVMGVGQGFAERYARAVEAVTAEDLHRVANAYLVSPTIVVLGPVSP
jgi:predicted Zn-dependent peptidase